MSADKKPDIDPRLVEGTLQYLAAILPGERSDAQLEAMRKNIAAMHERAARLSAFPLRNADEPDFVFRPYRSEESR